jgi:hypothetical protein
LWLLEELSGSKIRSRQTGNVICIGQESVIMINHLTGGPPATCVTPGLPGPGVSRGPVNQLRVIKKMF